MIKLPDWYEHVQTTDKNYTKKVSYGNQKFTSINATYQIMLATKYLGMYGEGWGVDNMEFNVIRDATNKPLLLTLDAQFYYPSGRFQISTESRIYTKKGELVDDLRKKLLTDITTKALSKIGFNADVFLGMYDDDKYLSNMDPEKPLVKKKLPSTLKKQMLTAIKNAKTVETINYTLARLDEYKASEDIIKEVTDAANEKTKELI